MRWQQKEPTWTKVHITDTEYEYRWVDDTVQEFLGEVAGEIAQTDWKVRRFEDQQVLKGEGKLGRTKDSREEYLSLLEYREKLRQLHDWVEANRTEPPEDMMP